MINVQKVVLVEMSEVTEYNISEKVCLSLQNVSNRLQIQNPVFNIYKSTDYGENHLGVIFKVEISNEQGKKIHVIIKHAPRSPLYRSFFPIHCVFVREGYTYSKVLFEFSKFQKQKNVNCAFGYFPKFYDAVLDIEDEAVLLENVTKLGYKNPDFAAALSYPHALLVVRELGKLHAISFAMRDQRKEVFDELSQNMNEFYFSQFEDVEKLNVCYKNWVLAARNSLNQREDKYIYDRLDAFQNKFFETVCDAVSSKLCNEHAVICHGDVWSGNLLFKYSDNGLPESACFLDWQIARYGSPALDLSHFLFTSTDKALRNLHYEDLIKNYHQSFSEYLEQLGSDPEKLFPMTVLKQHLKKFSIFGLCMAIQVLWLTLNVSKESYYDIDAATDSDVKNVTSQFNKPNLKSYNVRMRDVILDYFKFGFEL